MTAGIVALGIANGSQGRAPAELSAGRLLPAVAVCVLVCAAAYASGFLLLSRAYQHGRAILVTAVSDLCARLVAIGVGIAALGEALAGEPRLRALAIVGYGGIVLGAVLLARFSGEELAAGLAKKRTVDP